MRNAEKSPESQMEVTPDQLSRDRREFLIKSGKLVAYTAPAIAALLLFDNKKAYATG
jgi:hypothetical protein